MRVRKLEMIIGPEKDLTFKWLTFNSKFIKG